MSRVSREQAAANRKAVVGSASRLFREHGFDGVGINDVMAEAGLTHGGFYGQFGSKEALAGEACGEAFDTVEAALAEEGKGPVTDRLERMARFYLAPKPAGRGCPMATLAGDVGRTRPGGPVRRAFTAGVRCLASVISGDRPEGEALGLFAALVGAAVLRRASDDPALSQAIDEAVLRIATRLDGR